MTKSKKVNKWDAAPESIRKLKELIDKQRLSISLGECEDLIGLDALEKVLCDYNELEAKHQMDCGLISDYAEENARLKQKNEKASNNIRDLRRVLEENDIATYLNPVAVSWGVANVALQKKTEHFNTQLDNLRERLREAERNKEDALKKMTQDVTELEKEKLELEEKLKEAEKSKEIWIAHYHDMSDICSREDDDSEMLQAILRKDGYTIEYDVDIDDETIRCQDSFDLRKETTQDEVLYQYGRWTLIRPLNFSEAKENADAAILRNQCKRHIDLLDKLRLALEDAGIRVEWNEAALKWNLRNTANICESWSCKHHFEEELRIREKEKDEKDKLIDELNQKVKALEKENKELKDTLNEDGEFGKYVGKCVADSIQEGLKYAEHKCEELNRKIKELKTENNNLTTDNKRLRDAVEAWFNMFNDMRHKRDALKKENEKLKEINKSCPVACECENFKPKVHHSYDPLDDLPDVEHS